MILLPSWTSSNPCPERWARAVAASTRRRDAELRTTARRGTRFFGDLPTPITVGSAVDGPNVSTSSH